MKILLILFQMIQPFLLMQPIEKSLRTGDFSNFKQICGEKISVYFENPFRLKGYFFTENFVDKFSSSFSQYDVNRLEWSSWQIEENFAIQSLNLVLKSKKSEKIIYYKFVFFMIKKEVNIIKFNGDKNQIVFEEDPGWGIGGEFEVMGSIFSTNKGLYKIIEKRGANYWVKKAINTSVIQSDNRTGFRAKAWKLYYLRGISI